VRTIIQNNKGTKGNTEAQISPLVDKGTYRIEENHKCSKEKIRKKVTTQNKDRKTKRHTSIKNQNKQRQ
jgi:hypothetical protein